VSCDTGETVFEANPDSPVPPASNQKLMTTITAISTLGPEFEFTTTLARKGEDFYIIGDGDPGFGDPDLMDPVTQGVDEWAEALLKKGIKEIKGKLIFDESVFDGQYRHPKWLSKYLNHWYAAPVAGFCMNDNCLDLSVDFDKDRKAMITIVPGMENVSVSPAWIPSKGGQTFISSAWESPEKLKVRVTLGSRPAGPVNFAVNDPARFFASVVQNRFRAYGIKVPDEVEFGKIRKPFGQLPEDLVILAQSKTPIFDAVTRANRNSQNLFAECLFKRMAYQSAVNSSKPESGSWELGSKAAKTFLSQEVQTPVDRLVIDDGSGLSPYNRETAGTFTALLGYVTKQPWRDRFLDTLAVAGKSGTLKRRMRHTAAEGRVLAKTGYISNVSALSGYVVDESNQPRYIFSMLFNFSPAGRLWQVKEIEDKICVSLASCVAAEAAERAKTTEPSAPSKAATMSGKNTTSGPETNESDTDEEIDD
jgi:D-alanyl-D-alanine carboxypeptidase/D-alanyl-D-alanine-endopeptidase (penicillin-binding protein 4)